MAYRIVREPEFTATVAVQPPGDELRQSFTARFRALPLSEVQVFDLASPSGTEDFLRRVWVGFEGVIEEDGRPAEWSPELRDELIDQVWLRMPLVVAYRQGLTGAARGN